MSFSCFKGRLHVQLFAPQNSNFSLFFVAIFENTHEYIACKQTRRTEIGISSNFRLNLTELPSNFRVFAAINRADIADSLHATENCRSKRLETR